MLIHGDLHHVTGSISHQDCALIICGMLEEFLAEIIAEGICKVSVKLSGVAHQNKPTCHKLNDVSLSFLEDHLNIFRLPFFKFLLKITAAMLVLAKAVDLSTQVVERNMCKA